MRKIFFLLALLQLVHCRPPGTENPDLEQLKKEIIQVEKAFNDMAAEESIKAAFLHYAAETAVLSRGGKLIEGKAAIGAYFDSRTAQDPKLTWSPTFVDVAQSGDLAYTYGPYTFTARDTNGEEIKAEGYFHTVWKKQPSGEWKYVYD